MLLETQNKDQNGKNLSIRAKTLKTGSYMRKIVSDYGASPVTSRRFIGLCVTWMPEDVTAKVVREGLRPCQAGLAVQMNSVPNGHPREFSSRRGFAAILRKVIAGATRERPCS
jgi:hypothetical protein